MATKALQLKALEEEYIVMGMAAYGQASFLDEIKKIAEMCADTSIENFRGDLLFEEFLSYAAMNKFEFASSIQAFAEQEIMELAIKARGFGSKLCYSGGVAQNIVANSKIRPLFEDMWIAINPTDGGSAIGSAARTWALENNKNKIKWKNPYLGYEMGEINAKEVVDYLLKHNYCGIASGRAEFGPRALGNRSLIADPRRDIKSTVNQIKRRQPFRPFAPAILEEYANEYFEGPMNEYMQYSCDAKHDYQSVTHIDGTARVQIVKKDNPSILRKILEEFYEKTSVPMLLNTSLNIRGKPIVNDKYDCFLFQKLNSTKVFYNDIS
jgi:carbamoyltransferase